MRSFYFGSADSAATDIRTSQIYAANVETQSAISPESLAHQGFELRFREVKSGQTTARQFQCVRKCNVLLTSHMIVRDAEGRPQDVDAIAHNDVLAGCRPDGVRIQHSDIEVVLPVGDVSRRANVAPRVEHHVAKAVNADVHVNVRTVPSHVVVHGCDFWFSQRRFAAVDETSALNNFEFKFHILKLTQTLRLTVLGFGGRQL